MESEVAASRSSWGLKGGKGFVEYGVNVFMFFFEFFGPSLCECEEQAVRRGRGLEWEVWRETGSVGFHACVENGYGFVVLPHIGSWACD